MKEAEKYYGLRITSAKIDESALELSFINGTTVRFSDHGQICCERRYMNTDDDINSLVGNKLVKVEIKDGGYNGDRADRYEVLECQFLEIQTDKGFITAANYNYHNGYYGGFSLEVSEV